MKLAVIPARGGSKRIPLKNIKSFCGKPMLNWSVEAARKSQCFDRIVVSTDSDEIADAAIAAGAEVPFMRPAELADDHTGTAAVVRHAISALDDDADLVCCLHATAPFLRAADLQRSLSLLQSGAADYCFSATTFAFPIQRALRRTAQGGVEMFQPEHRLTRSQDLEEAIHDAGQFYWGRAGAWLADVPFFSAAGAPYLLPRYRVQDVDTPEDWRQAELMFHALQAGEL